MEGLKMIPYVALIIAISGIVIGAAVITLAKFDDTVDTCFNSSYIQNSSLTGDNCYCLNHTVYASGETVGPSNSNMSDAGWAICNAKSATGDVAEQLPTVAIIAVMVIIISIIAGVFVYMKYFA